MISNLFPYISYKSVLDIRPEFLRKNGIRLLLLDLDNTLSPYYRSSPIEGLEMWVDSIKAADINMAIVSNNKKDRAVKFAEKYGMDCIINAEKPQPDAIFKMMEKFGCTGTETALAGDQIFADVLAANRSGVMAILVEPISFNNPLFAMRYFFELPFRKKCKIKKYE